MGDSGADIVDKLLFDKLLAVPDAVEHLAHRNWRDGMLADQAEALLVFRRRWVFHPEHAERFDTLAEARRFDGRQAVVHVVQEMLIEAKFTAHRVKQFWREIEVFLSGPELLFRPVAFGGGLVGQSLPFSHAVGGFHARHAALDADRLKAHLLMAGVIFQHVVNGVPGGVAVDHYALTGCAAQQLVERHICRFGFDVPERHIHSGDSRHGDRPAAPVGALIEELPDIFDTVRVAANQLRAEVIFQVGSNGELTPVQRGVTEANDPFIGSDFKGDKVPPRAGNKHVSRDNLHNSFPYIVRCDAGNLPINPTTIQV